jgi:hypothetical protein
MKIHDDLVAMKIFPERIGAWIIAGIQNICAIAVIISEFTM